MSLMGDWERNKIFRFFCSYPVKLTKDTWRSHVQGSLSSQMEKRPTSFHAASPEKDSLGGDPPFQLNIHDLVILQAQVWATCSSKPLTSLGLKPNLCTCARFPETTLKLDDSLGFTGLRKAYFSELDILLCYITAKGYELKSEQNKKYMGQSPGETRWKPPGVLC